MPGISRTPAEVLVQAAALIERTGFVPGACAVDDAGAVVEPLSPAARRYCISGAARAVVGPFEDGDGTAAERTYIAAMDAFCAFVGTVRVQDWADAGHSDSEVVAMMRRAAQPHE